MHGILKTIEQKELEIPTNFFRDELFIMRELNIVKLHFHFFSNLERNIKKLDILYKEFIWWLSQRLLRNEFFMYRKLSSSYWQVLTYD